jgi:hypothetical protein
MPESGSDPTAFRARKLIDPLVTLEAKLFLRVQVVVREDLWQGDPATGLRGPLSEWRRIQGRSVDGPCQFR